MHYACSTCIKGLGHISEIFLVTCFKNKQISALIESYCCRREDEDGAKKKLAAA